ILREHCTVCHQPDGSAPFSLSTFAAVRTRATLIVRATKTRYMPPWKPVPGHGDFANVRRLTDEQIAIIERWVEAGAVEGDPAEAAVPRADGSVWDFGAP